MCVFCTAHIYVCVQVNAATIDGVTPLYNCCASGSVACMELLLQKGAHTHTTHTHFPSALHEACKRGKYIKEAPCMQYMAEQLNVQGSCAVIVGLICVCFFRRPATVSCTISQTPHHQVLVEFWLNDSSHFCMVAFLK